MGDIINADELERLERKMPTFMKLLENLSDEDIINLCECESFDEYQKKYSEKNKNE